MDIARRPPAGSEAAAWLARTAVTPRFHLHLGDVPLGHIYEVADELEEKGANLLGIGRGLGKAGPGLPTGQVGPVSRRRLEDHALEPVAEASEAGRRG